MPKTDKPQPRHKSSHRSGQPAQVADVSRTANRSIASTDGEVMVPKDSRDTRATIEQWRQDSSRKIEISRLDRRKPAQANSLVFPSSAHSMLRAKARERPVPVPALDPKAAESQSKPWLPDNHSGRSLSTPYGISPKVEPSNRPLPPAEDPVKRSRRRCPPAPSRHYVLTHSTPAVSSRAPATQVDAEVSTSKSTQSQRDEPSWPPDGPATVKRQQHTPKSSIDSLYRSQSDRRTPQATRPAAHARTSSEPQMGADPSLQSPQGKSVADTVRKTSRDVRPSPSDAESSRSPHNPTSTSARLKAALPVQELSTARSVRVDANGLARAKSYKATVVYPSPDPAPPPLPPKRPPTDIWQDAPRPLAKSPTEHKTHGHRESPSRRRKEKEPEVYVITMRQVAEKENRRTQKTLDDEFAKWGPVPNVAPEAGNVGSRTRPLVVRKRSAMLTREELERTGY